MAIEITVPRLGWTMEEGTFVGWLKQAGERVKEGEPLFIIEGDKATEEVAATDSGVLHIPTGSPATGSDVRVGALLGYLLAEGETAPAAPIAESQRSEDRSQQSAVPPQEPLAPAKRSGADPDTSFPKPEARTQSTTPRISPRAARTAAALGVDWTKLRGSGRTGRIRERDVLAAVQERRDSLPQLAGRMAPVSSFRRTIARRMSAGVHEAAPVTLTTRADASNLVQARERMKATQSSGQPVPTFNDLFVKLVATALQQHPALNSQWHEDKIFSPNEINIALAMETEQGLLAPVIRNVPDLSIHQIATASRALSEQARAGRLARDNFEGGTFTVTNLGNLGVETFTPIINLPQCAILGIGRIAREPVVVAEQIVIREIVPLSLTFDHRVLDGATAARFLATLRKLVDNPVSWLGL